MLQRFRKIFQRRSDEQEQGSPALVDPRLLEAKAESEDIAQQQRNLDEIAQRQMENRERELADIDTVVDALLSSDAETFLKLIEQPGGQ